MSHIHFRATPHEIRKMFALAANASKPMGMGYLHARIDDHFTAENFDHFTAENFDHFTAENFDHFTAENFDYITDLDMIRHPSVDYVKGRMTKCYVRHVNGDVYKMDEPRHDYQSWIRTYPTARALIEAAGLTVITETTPEVSLG